MKFLKEKKYVISSHLSEILKTPEMREALDDDNFKAAYDIINRHNRAYTHEFTELMWKLGDNPLDYMDCIPDYFLYRSDIAEFVVPSHIKCINHCAFGECKNLTHVDLSKCVDLTDISSNVFAICESLSSIDLSKCTNLINIGENAFIGCSKLTTVVLPDSLMHLSWQVFMGCDNLTNIVLPDGLLKMEHAVFASCHSLESITIPKSIKMLGQYLFSNCKNLRKVRVPEKFKSKDAWSLGVPHYFEIEYY